MKSVCFFSCLVVVLGVSYVDAQDEYAPATLNERRAALFSASRSKMFDPSAGWSDARTTVSGRAGSSDAGGSQMLQRMGESSTLESLRANPMSMFLTIGGGIQEMMAIDSAGETEVIDSLDGTDLTGLGADDVNAGRAAALVNSTGLYSPRFARPDPDDLEQMRFRDRKHLENDVLSREDELADRLNEKFALEGDARIKLTVIQGVAFLQGTVDSKDKRKVAEIFVGFEPGVDEVRNELKVVAP